MRRLTVLSLMLASCGPGEWPGLPKGGYPREKPFCQRDAKEIKDLLYRIENSDLKSLGITFQFDGKNWQLVEGKMVDEQEMLQRLVSFATLSFAGYNRFRTDDTLKNYYLKGNAGRAYLITHNYPIRDDYPCADSSNQR